jgi:hypothetical protein
LKLPILNLLLWVKNQNGQDLVTPLRRTLKHQAKGNNLHLEKTPKAIL